MRRNSRHSTHHKRHHRRSSINNKRAEQLEKLVDQHNKNNSNTHTHHNDQSNPSDVNQTTINQEQSKLSWAEKYARERAKTPATPVIQNLLQKKHAAHINSASGTDADATLRSRRAYAGVKCPECGLVGYYRINCPKCQSETPVTVDVVTDSWRPITPDHMRQAKMQQEREDDPMYQVEQANFKSESEVKTQTGLGNASWFWKKDDVIWQVRLN